MVDWGLVNARPVYDLPHDTSDAEKRFEGANDHLDLNWEKAWIPNLLENLRIVGDFNRHSVYGMNGYSRGTAYLVGAGPSLKGNVGDFKKWAEEDTFCSAHSLKYLLSIGKRPKYVCVLDAKEAQAEFLDIGGEAKGITLLMDIVCHPKIFDVWKGETYFFRSTARGTTETAAKLWNITDFPGVIFSGGNVMTSLLCMVVDGMEFGRVVFVGHDYCNLPWSTGGVDYADGTNDYGKNIGAVEIAGYKVPDGPERDRMIREKFQTDRTMCIDIQGLGVPSLGRMENYKIWTDLFTANRTGTDFVNCTEGGILGAYPEGNIRTIRQEPLKSVQ